VKGKIRQGLVEIWKVKGSEDGGDGVEKERGTQRIYAPSALRPGKGAVTREPVLALLAGSLRGATGSLKKHPWRRWRRCQRKNAKQIGRAGRGG